MLFYFAFGFPLSSTSNIFSEEPWIDFFGKTLLEEQIFELASNTLHHINSAKLSWITLPWLGSRIILRGWGPPDPQNILKHPGFPQGALNCSESDFFGQNLHEVFCTKSANNTEKEFPNKEINAIFGLTTPKYPYVYQFIFIICKKFFKLLAPENHCTCIVLVM